MSADAAERLGGLAGSAEALGGVSGRPPEPAAGLTNGPRDLPRMVAPAVPALVPRGGHFEGEVAVSGETRIEGRVEGCLRGSGRVVVGPDGRIEGAVECEQLDSEGTIRGPVVARERVRLGPGALLEGDVSTPLIEIEDSAVWQGVARVGLAGSEGAEKA